MPVQKDKSKSGMSYKGKTKKAAPKKGKKN